MKGTWDIDLKFTPRQLLANIGSEAISIFDAVDSQLGMKLDLQKIPTPVIVVDSVNQKPTDNPPGVTTSLPPVAPPEFEVANITPSAVVAPLGSAQVSVAPPPQLSWPADSNRAIPRLAATTIGDGTASGPKVSADTVTLDIELTTVGVAVGVPATKGAIGTVQPDPFTSSSMSGGPGGKPPPFT